MNPGRKSKKIHQYEEGADGNGAAQKIKDITLKTFKGEEAVTLLFGRLPHGSAYSMAPTLCKIPVDEPKKITA